MTNEEQSLSKKEFQEKKKAEERTQRIRELLTLSENELVVDFIRRHWVELAPKMAIPFVLALISGALFAFRAVGGDFIRTGVRLEQPFDSVNIFLVFFFIVVALLVVVSQVTNPKDTRNRNILLVISAVLLMVVAFRYQGGRLLYIEPTAAQAQIFDTINIALLLIALTSIGFMFYLYIEWNDDYLILTNQRVIQWSQVLLGKHSQGQIFLDNVQGVVAKTNTYFQHWLNYGTITITSAAFGPPITFHNATAPRQMQGKIMGKVRDVQGQEKQENFRQLLKTNVFSNSVPPLRPPVASSHPAEYPSFIKRSYLAVRQWMMKAFEENPKYDEKSATYTWRPHWVFILWVLVPPVGFLIISLIVLFTVSGLVVISVPTLIVAILAILVVFLGWAAYVVEDELNEEYILTKTNVIDVEKKPFGPEDRNLAGLDKIQNVTFKTTLVGRMFGYGDVVLETAGGGQSLTFHRLPKPRDVVAKVNEYRVNFKKSERERTLQETLNLLKHYHAEHHEHLVEAQQQYLRELLSSPVPRTGAS
jgi:hypothetical protein